MSADRDLGALTGALLAAARRAGADQADAMAVSAEMTAIDARAGGLEHAERAEAVEIGLRVLIGGRQACVSASDHSEATIAEMAERAVAMARHAPVDEWLGVADPDELASRRDAAGLESADPGAAPTPEALEQSALAAEAAALEAKGISQVESASASYSRRLMRIEASNGFAGGYARTSHALSTVAITGEGLGMERDYAGEGRVWAEDLPAPETIGKLAAERTLARKGAKKPPTGAFPILYDRRVSASLISHLLGAVNGSAIARGASWLLRAMDEKVLPDGLSLTEDPHRPRFGGSRLFDAEGLPTARRTIVDAGILRGWTLDLATARKLGLQSTASASRGLSSPPSPGISNVILSGGQGSADDLIADMGRGLIVTSMLGASINATTGDYSRGAAGFWVENGQISHPVNECTIAGNLRDMLLSIRAAADAEPWRSIEVPSLLVEGMTIAGA
ncbi:TldD/PmbA family protein (plasmid) [Paracoccus sp. TK19116]|uniref:TldD/PmbA family protein n=1 Tax=Paracoccus albicereus TaxID=2922394 RepID=A0ABT1MP77_9RHOB|nr:TldD/PmbA family protein [Paracoccus albicereus]MCQ0969351.1 TldD/PmbA family protein [Paracoccus albicereus]